MLRWACSAHPLTDKHTGASNSPGPVIEWKVPGSHWQPGMLSLGNLWWCQHHSLPFLHPSIIYRFIPQWGRQSPNACPWTVGGSCSTPTEIAGRTCKKHRERSPGSGEIQIRAIFLNSLLASWMCRVLFFLGGGVVCMPPSLAHQSSQGGFKTEILFCGKDWTVQRSKCFVKLHKCHND